MRNKPEKYFEHRHNENEFFIKKLFGVQAARAFGETNMSNLNIVDIAKALEARKKELSLIGKFIGTFFGKSGKQKPTKGRSESVQRPTIQQENMRVMLVTSAQQSPVGQTEPAKVNNMQNFTLESEEDGPSLD